ncbi:hypothetical protein SCP_0300040 [Sparassis crispa]|uniref:Uncharacterized protein n=1 Tax=Sparassis crispa TaxID=139825 RepID=A0A401GDN5_9APHY|nr:hypothetical protein SCP_0300040 [Sparassis crispa]GBE80289.1 hypothetical protein SCP_0300040 [Sparassis crispa]
MRIVVHVRCARSRLGRGADLLKGLRTGEVALLRTTPTTAAQGYSRRVETMARIAKVALVAAGWWPEQV